MLQTFPAKLIEKRDLTHDVMSLKFQLDTPPPAVSGQYMIVHVPDSGGQAYRRLFSIASDCSNVQTFAIVAKIIPSGIASEYFKKLQVGDSIELQGPAGLFFIKKNDRDKMFLATGTGIAPIKTMINELLNETNNNRLQLLWGLRTYKDVYFLDEFKKLTQEYKNFSFKICLSRENSDAIPEEDRQYFVLGRVTQHLDAKLTDTDIYLCGDRTVVESLRQYLYDRGIKKESVIFEKF